MLCSLVVKGNEVEVDKIVDLFCHKYDGELGEKRNEGSVCTAWIYCPGVEKEEVVDQLTNVKWIGFIENFERRTLQVATSDIGSAEIDMLYTVCDYDLHGDDRIASQYCPDSDFEEDIFWESAGESTTIYYECPCEKWWTQQ